MAILLFGTISSAAEPPSLKVMVLDEKTVVVRGNGFPQDRLLVSADEDVPHASVACYTDFTRVALVKSGQFEVTINPSKTVGCGFRCGREPSGYTVAVETLGGTPVAEAKFSCVAARRAR